MNYTNIDKEFNGQYILCYNCKVKFPKKSLKSKKNAKFKNITIKFLLQKNLPQKYTDMNIFQTFNLHCYSYFELFFLLSSVITK